MIKKIKFRRLILAINIGIVLLLIIIIIKNLKYSKKKIEYEQKIANLQQAGINFSENIENEDKEIKTYYVSADGISNDGTDINNPMSLNEANKKTYYGNEKVLFKRGDTFYGVINFNVEATEEKMFYIGTYGEGEEKPIISGANILVNSNAWLYDEENLYKIDLSNYSNFYGIGRTYWEPYNIGFLEDENGNIYARRVGTAYRKLSGNTQDWVNNYQIPVWYGDITKRSDYQSYMGLVPSDDPRYTRNSKGKIVPIQELGWGKADEEVTHVMLRFSANDQGAYIGSVGSKFWVDNVAFVY